MITKLTKNDLQQQQMKFKAGEIATLKFMCLVSYLMTGPSGPDLLAECWFARVQKTERVKRLVLVSAYWIKQIKLKTEKGNWHSTWTFFIV